MRDLLFYNSTGLENKEENTIEYDVVFFKPSIKNLRLHQSSSILFLLWYIFSQNKYSVSYVDQ